MTADRFLALVAAYGADPRHWPVDERASAQAFVLTHPDMARTALNEADRTDALLFASAAPRVSMELRDRVLAAAMSQHQQAARSGGRWLDGLGLMFGAGWAAAACAGVVAGVLMTGQMTADTRADAVLYEATMSGVDDTEVLG